MPSSYTRLYVHLVWATWDRLPLITPELEAKLYAAFASKCRELKCDCVAVGGVLDHVHLLVRCAADVAVSQLVGEIKGSSTHLVTHVLSPEAGFRWQGSYSAFSVSPGNVGRASEYILNQKDHHQSGDIYPELERFWEGTPGGTPG